LLRQLCAQGHSLRKFYNVFSLAVLWLETLDKSRNNEPNKNWKKSFQIHLEKILPFFVQLFSVRSQQKHYLFTASKKYLAVGETGLGEIAFGEITFDEIALGENAVGEIVVSEIS
jgi:hypothetical protein